MKINWKVRFKNPAFWAVLIPALAGLIYAVYVLANNLPDYDESAISGLVGAITSILALFGITVDPTTKGVSDSDRAMNYDYPACDEKGGDNNGNQDE
jgi:phi LC3 family holin